MSDLEKLEDASFRLKTQLQLAKDFGQHGFEFPEHFTNQPCDVSEIERLIQQHLSVILQASVSRWNALLYTIDIPEKTLLNLELSPKNQLTELTWMIIKREAQKVYLKSRTW
jgi:hypothetical protein